MSAPALPQLADWGNFYVIVGSAAAGLTGLMFVVITLGAQAQTIGNEQGLRGFVTPTVVHFCAALLLAAIVTSPGHRPITLGLTIAGCGVAGLAYVGWAMQQARRQQDYTPVRSDWLWHACMPAVAYSALVAAAALLLTGYASRGLYTLAAATLLLLFTGIHNAWDTALWVAVSTTRRQGGPEDGGNKDGAEN